MKDRMFQPKVALDLAKKTLGPKSVWVPIIDESLKICNEHGNEQTFQFQLKKKKLILIRVMCPDLIFSIKG